MEVPTTCRVVLDCYCLILLGVTALFRRHATVTVQTANGRAGQLGNTCAGALDDVPQTKCVHIGGITRAKHDGACHRGEIALAGSGVGSLQNGILLYGHRERERTSLRRRRLGVWRNFYHVRCPELVGQNTGSGAERIRGAFRNGRQPIGRLCSFSTKSTPSVAGSRYRHGTDSGGGAGNTTRS